MASGVPGASQPLPTVLVSAGAWREEAAGGSREKLQLQLTVEAEDPGDFRLAVRSPARGPNSVVIGEFRLRDIAYAVRGACCHQLSLLADPTTSITFNFDDEREAQKWWTVLSSSLREAQKAAQGHVTPLVAAMPRPRPEVSSGNPFSMEAEPPASALDDLGTKEEMGARLARCIESGDPALAAKYAAELARQRVPVQVQLKPTCYPKSEICMKVGVEDAKASVNISTYVYTHTTIAMLKQQIFRDYQFHPGIQRWIIGQCLCSDERTVGSYGIRHHGDTAFLYLLGAKQAKLPPPDPEEIPPTQPLPRPVVNLKPEMMEIGSHSKPTHATPPSPVQIGWPCSICTFINVPTRPGCEMCSADRPAHYVVPEGYRPGESERRRIQQENDGLQQYKKALEEERQQNFLHIIQLDSETLIPNQTTIDCPICYTTIPAGDGVLLRECLHSFCRECLRQLVNCCEEPEVSCPYRDEMYACDSKLQEREIRALVSLEEYSRFLERGLVVAESRSRNSYHCRTADCKGWCIYEDAVNNFICPICQAHNCLTCKAIHVGMNCKEYQDDLRIRAQNDAAARQTNDMLRIYVGMNCKEYQDDLRIRAQNDAAARQTNDMLRTLVQTGEAMHCPLCEIIVQKKDGCDWIRCTMCQTEICWVTKGPRWGPQGPGDTSGGCQCNMNGRKCDPRCQNCH